MLICMLYIHARHAHTQIPKFYDADRKKSDIVLISLHLTNVISIIMTFILRIITISQHYQHYLPEEALILSTNPSPHISFVNKPFNKEIYYIQSSPNEGCRVLYLNYSSVTDAADQLLKERRFIPSSGKLMVLPGPCIIVFG